MGNLLDAYNIIIQYVEKIFRVFERKVPLKIVTLTRNFEPSRGYEFKNFRFFLNVFYIFCDISWLKCPMIIILLPMYRDTLGQPFRYLQHHTVCTKKFQSLWKQSFTQNFWIQNSGRVRNFSSKSRFWGKLFFQRFWKFFYTPYDNVVGI